MPSKLYIDVLDYWSIIHVLKHSRSGYKVHYLRHAQGYSGRLILSFLHLLGRKPLQLRSLFEEPNSRWHIEYHAGVFDFIKGYMEPNMLAQVQCLGQRSEIEKLRLMRYLVNACWPKIREAYGLMLHVCVDKEETVILIQNSSLLSNLIEYFHASGRQIKAYYAPGRRYDASTDRKVSTPSVLFSAISIISTIRNIFPKVLVAVWRYIWRYGLNVNSENYEVLALAYQNPTPGYNDLFWAELVRKEHSYKVFGIQLSDLSESAREFYLKLTDRLEKKDSISF